MGRDLELEVNGPYPVWELDDVVPDRGEMWASWNQACRDRVEVLAIELTRVGVSLVLDPAVD